MNVYSLSSAILSPFYAKIINFLRQSWKNNSTWNCIGNSKRDHLLLFIESGSVTYFDRNGKLFSAQTGDVVYTPKGCEYAVKFTKKEGVRTLALRFELYSKDAVPFSFSSGPLLFPSKKSYLSFFLEAEQISQQPLYIPVKHYALLYSLLAEMGESELKSLPSSQPFFLIKNGLSYMITHLDENTSIEELAKMCSISTVYFRKLFKSYTGSSPALYRLNLRIKKACEYLQHGVNSIIEISNTLGFTSPSYFIKIFYKIMGETPLSYRKKHH